MVSEDSNIVGGAAGIHMTYTREGRPTGEGYLELGSEEDVERALTKHNEHLGPRYIEGMHRSLAGCSNLVNVNDDKSFSVQANDNL